MFVYDFLIKNTPETVNECFCHGDFHYANALWKNGNVSAVLDFELSGRGNREFDVAWTIIRRPVQRFLAKREEVELFLKGYSSLEKFNLDYVKYYMVLIYSYFYEVGESDEEYKTYVIKVLKALCQV